MKDRKIIIVSNRLPVRVEIKNEEWIYHTSEGGLATGLGSMFKEGNNVWIGWPGAHIPNEKIKEIIIRDFKEQHLYPVLLSPKEIEHYYDGFSNDTLWPLFHYFPSYANYSLKDWETYKSVNQKFADAVTEIAEPGDVIWIQDYQLMLVPEMVHKAIPQSQHRFLPAYPLPFLRSFPPYPLA